MRAWIILALMAIPLTASAQRITTETQTTRYIIPDSISYVPTTDTQRVVSMDDLTTRGQQHIAPRIRETERILYTEYRHAGLNETSATLKARRRAVSNAIEAERERIVFLINRRLAEIKELNRALAALEPKRQRVRRR